MMSKKVVIRMLIIILSIVLLVAIGIQVNLLFSIKGRVVFKSLDFNIIDDNAQYLTTSSVRNTKIFKYNNGEYKEIKIPEKITGARKLELTNAFIVCNNKPTKDECLGCYNVDGKLLVPIKYNEIKCKIINNKPVFICKIGN